MNHLSRVNVKEGKSELRLSLDENSSGEWDVRTARAERCCIEVSIVRSSEEGTCKSEYDSDLILSAEGAFSHGR